MKKITTLLALLLFTVTQGAYAQRTITGKVINGEDGLGMPGVSVVVKGTTTGTATDKDGNFVLRVPNNAIIEVSFTGFKTVEIPVGTQTRFGITLQLDVQALGDVVVEARRIPPSEKVETSLGIERDKKTLTTAIYQLSGDEMRKRGYTTIADGIAGRIPGVQWGVGEGHFYIKYIRGITSFEGAKPPLYVIDGMPLTGDPTFLLNIDDVENITVLPSANAAILYGSAGANGVIAITTKKIRTVSQSSQNTSGQRTIMGKIIDENGFGMAGISVAVKGTTTKTTTDNDGNFALSVPKDAIIEVSLAGFKTVETPIENKSWYEITLQPEV